VLFLRLSIVYVWFLPLEARKCVERYCYRMSLSSVRPFVTLVDRGLSFAVWFQQWSILIGNVRNVTILSLYRSAYISHYCVNSLGLT